jgi:hypothetical protein
VEEGEEEWPPWRYTFPDSPEEYARNQVDALILQAQIEHGDEKIPGRGSWEDSGHPEVPRLHYGFVDAHRDLNLAIQRSKQK